MKTHLISIVILVLLILLVIGIHKSFYVLLGIAAIILISFTYSMIYTGVSRNITNKDTDENS